jgi:hypothetical protein
MAGFSMPQTALEAAAVLKFCFPATVHWDVSIHPSVLRINILITKWVMFWYELYLYKHGAWFAAKSTIG